MEGREGGRERRRKGRREERKKEGERKGERGRGTKASYYTTQTDVKTNIYKIRGPVVFLFTIYK